MFHIQGRVDLMASCSFHYDLLLLCSYKAMTTSHPIRGTPVLAAALARRFIKEGIFVCTVLHKFHTFSQILKLKVLMLLPRLLVKITRLRGWLTLPDRLVRAFYTLSLIFRLNVSVLPPLLLLKITSIEGSLTPANSVSLVFTIQ